MRRPSLPEQILVCATHAFDPEQTYVGINAKSAVMIEYRLSPHLSNTALNYLFASAWDGHVESDIASTLDRCALWDSANDGDRLVGFVKVVLDGDKHGFVLDTTTHSDYQRRGVGKRLLEHGIDASRNRGIRWLHVDFEPHLTKFYQGAGFRPACAGLLDLSQSAIGGD